MTPLYASAQFEKGWHVHENDTLPYQLLEPLALNEDSSYPIVIFLHGAGERGTDNDLQLKHGSQLFLHPANRKKHPSFVIFPQCPRDSFWANLTFNYENNYGINNLTWQEGFSQPMVLVLDLLRNLQQKYNIDEDRIYVMGLSMGGFGTLDLLQKRSDIFAAGIAICGGADPKRFNKLLDTPLWLFHGSEDDIVPVELSRQVVAFIDGEGKKVRYTEFEGVKHNSWDNAFKEKALLNWLYDQNRYER